jgi:hypothetical protein
MRLSEQRIQFLAKQIAAAIIDEGAVETSMSGFVLESDIARHIQADLQIEDQIDAEVNASIHRMKRPPVQDSPEWRAMFTQLKQEIAKRKGYIL